LNSAHLLLVSYDPENCQVPPPGMLTDMFGLTPAEASVAIGIVAGKQLAEIAADRGVKTGTVRVYSKTVFANSDSRPGRIGSACDPRGLPDPAARLGRRKRRARGRALMFVGLPDRREKNFGIGAKKKICILPTWGVRYGPKGQYGKQSIRRRARCWAGTDLRKMQKRVEQIALQRLWLPGH
jgi:hypothetical protein